MFTFDPTEHRYTIDGRRLPSVTEVLSQWLKVDAGWSFYLNTITGQKIDAGIFEAAGDRGTAVHTILQLCVTGQGVDREALDPSLVPYLDSIEAWVERYKPKVILCEVPLHHEKLMYAGTPDLFCECKGIKHPVLLDGKSGMRGQVGPQTSAYEPLVRGETGFKGLMGRYVLDIKPDGYKFEPCRSVTDFAYFKTRLWLYQYERRMAI